MCGDCMIADKSPIYEELYVLLYYFLKISPLFCIQFYWYFMKNNLNMISFQECRRCGSFLKKSLLECRSDLTVCKVKNESLLRIHEGLEMLRKAQDQIEKAMHQVQSQLCPSLDANVITTLQQVQ